MIIKDILVSTLQIPLIKPFKTSLRNVTLLESIVVEIKTDCETVGYGETAPTEAITGESTKSIISAIDMIKKSVLNKDIKDFNSLINMVQNSIKGNNSAKSAVEIALYDIYSQFLNLPLYRYLGGSKTEFKTNITISLNDIDTMIQDSMEALKKGFDSLKIKLGDNYKEDIQRVEEISKVVDKNISLKLDANQGWSKEETLLFLNEIEKRGVNVDFIEQPLNRYDIDGLRYIKERTSIPILADESVFSPKDAIKLLELSAADMINIKLDKCGGISKALLIADICREYDIKCMIGCMLEGAVSVGAAAHVASARSDVIVSYDLDSPMLCKETPVVGGVEFKAPFVTLGKKSGLGIERIIK